MSSNLETVAFEHDDHMPYPSDVSGNVWAFVVLYLVLVYALERRFRMGIWFPAVSQRLPSLVLFTTGRSLLSVRVDDTL
jgi:hypothetical protein